MNGRAHLRPMPPPSKPSRGTLTGFVQPGGRSVCLSCLKTKALTCSAFKKQRLVTFLTFLTNPTLQCALHCIASYACARSLAMHGVLRIRLYKWRSWQTRWRLFIIYIYIYTLGDSATEKRLRMFCKVPRVSTDDAPPLPHYPAPLAVASGGNS